MTRITVLIAEDHMIVRQGLRALLKLEKDIDVVGEAENGRQAVVLTKQLKPHVVVMDIAMPLLNGMEATRQILKAMPATRVLILTAHSDDAYVSRVMAIGAAGYLIKQISSHVLADAIRKVHAGSTCLSPCISQRFMHHEKKAHACGELRSKKTAHTLSPRENEVLQLIVEGHANKETAVLLHISIKTVEKHRQSLMEKLNIHDVSGLTRHAIAAGIIESSVHVKLF
jgi:DNA-binding NarL/FixJ family response regulator